MGASFIVHDTSDSVGVATTDLDPAEQVTGRFQHSEGVVEVSLREPIPLGHKVAIVDIAEGGQVIKYGVPIGRATRPIRAGEHVHTHNLKGERWA